MWLHFVTSKLNIVKKSYHSLLNYICISESAIIWIAMDLNALNILKISIFYLPRFGGVLSNFKALDKMSSFILCPGKIMPRGFSEQVMTFSSKF